MISVKRRVGHSAHRSLTSSLIPLVVQYCFWRDSPQWARASSFARFLDHTERRTTVGRLLWTTDQPVAETSTWQHTTLITDIHAHGGVRTHNLSWRAAADRAAAGTGSCKVWSVFNDDCVIMVLICNAFFSVLIALLCYSKIRRRIKLRCINSSRMMNAVSQELIWKNAYSKEDRQRSWWFVEISWTTACDGKWKQNCMFQSGFDFAVPAFGRCNALFITWNYVNYSILSLSYFWPV
jgi:hypothetical protein